MSKVKYNCLAGKNCNAADKCKHSVETKESHGTLSPKYDGLNCKFFEEVASESNTNASEKFDKAQK